MKIETNDKGTIVLKEVFNPILLETSDSEVLSICMRDGGFEFFYNGRLWSISKGSVTVLEHVEFKSNIVEDVAHSPFPDMASHANLDIIDGEPTCPKCSSYEWSYHPSKEKMYCADCGHVENEN